MKNVSERMGELDDHRTALKDRLVSRANSWRLYLRQVMDLEISHYQPTAKNSQDKLIDRTDYSKCREGVRNHIGSLKHADRGFIDTACDDCGTRLFDLSPSTILTSNPPKFWADCIGCGKRYALSLALRNYVDPAQLTDAKDTPSKLKLIILQMGESRIKISSCDDCPFQRDPDPYPSFCQLDKSATFSNSCPLVNLSVEVIRE